MSAFPDRRVSRAAGRSRPLRSPGSGGASRGGRRTARTCCGRSARDVRGAPRLRPCRGGRRCPCDAISGRGPPPRRGPIPARLPRAGSSPGMSRALRPARLMSRIRRRGGGSSGGGIRCVPRRSSRAGTRRADSPFGRKGIWRMSWRCGPPGSRTRRPSWPPSSRRYRVGSRPPHASSSSSRRRGWRCGVSPRPGRRRTRTR